MLPPSPPARFHAPDDHAIVVGIDHYREQFPQLGGCINDARLFRDWLLDVAGLDPANVQPLESRAPADPTDDTAYVPVRDTILARLTRFRNQVTATGKPVGRRLYLYCAGHGVAVPGQGEDTGLVLSNSELPQPIFALLGRQVIQAMRRDRTFQEVVVFMDCCRELRGGLAPQVMLEPIEDPSYQNGANHFCGLATAWNASTAERVLDHPFDPSQPPRQQGLFTHALLQVLGGVRTRAVTSTDLKNLVTAAVQALDPAEEHRPRFYVSEDHNVPVVFGDPAAQADAGPATVEVKVALNTPASGFQVLGGIPPSVVVQQPGPAPAEVTIQLPPGLYEFRPLAGMPPDPPILRSVAPAVAGGAIVVRI